MASVNKNAYIVAASIAGEMPEMDVAVAKVRTAIEAEAARHRDTGSFASSIRSGRAKRGARGVTDRAVWSEDPAAWSIEFGHLSGKTGGKKRDSVGGKFIFTNGAKKAAGS